MIKYALSLLLIFFSSVCFGANWYCSTSAQGSKNGTSWANAWACDSNLANTVVWGGSGVVVGDSLYIDGGVSGLTYTATSNSLLYVQASGTSGNRITIATGAKSPYPSGHDGMVTFDAGGSYSYLIFASVNYVTFDGEKNGARNWKLYNTKLTDNYPMVYTVSSQHIKMTYIEMEKMNIGVYQRGYDAVGGEFSYLYIHDLRGDAGLSLVGTNFNETPGYDKTLVHHCIIDINSAMDGSGAGADGIQGPAYGLTVYNNTFNHVSGPLDEEFPGACNLGTGWCHANHSDEIQIEGLYAKIYNNEFINSNDSSLDLDMFTSTPTYTGYLYIFNNTFYKNSNLTGPYVASKGLRVYSSDPAHEIQNLQNIFVFNNTFVDFIVANTVSFSWFAVGANPGVNNVHIKNNIVFNCGEAFRSWPSTGAVASDYGVDYNLVRAGSLGGVQIALDQAPGDPTTYTQPNGYIDIDPTFVSYSYNSLSNNFHLSASDTGARGRGVNLTSYCSAVPQLCSDKDGKQRPAGGVWDIGAYQFSSGIPSSVQGLTIQGGTLK